LTYLARATHNFATIRSSKGWDSINVYNVQ
jgi:hypothetical protein